MVVLRQLHEALVSLPRPCYRQGEDLIGNVSRSSREKAAENQGRQTSSDVAATATSEAGEGVSGNKGGHSTGKCNVVGNVLCSTTSTGSVSYERQLAVDLFFVMLDCLQVSDCTVAQRTAFLRDVCPVVDAVQFLLLRQWGEVIPEAISNSGKKICASSSAGLIAGSLLEVREPHQSQYFHHRPHHQRPHPTLNMVQSAGESCCCSERI